MSVLLEGVASAADASASERPVYAAQLARRERTAAQIFVRSSLLGLLPRGERSRPSTDVGAALRYPTFMSPRTQGQAGRQTFQALPFRAPMLAAGQRLARIFHERRIGWVGDADPLAFLGRGPVNEAIDAAHRGGAGLLGVAAPFPTWDAGRFGVNARARHWTEFYGLSARAAVLRTCFIGCADASNTRTCCLLRKLAAPIFNSLVRIVAVSAQARCPAEPDGAG